MKDEGSKCQQCNEGTVININSSECDCHINPPCAACTNPILVCDHCDFEYEPPKPKQKTPEQRAEEEAYWAVRRIEWDKQRKEQEALWKAMEEDSYPIEKIIDRDVPMEFDGAGRPQRRMSYRKVEGYFPPGTTKQDILKRYNADEMTLPRFSAFTNRYYRLTYFTD